MANTDVIDYRRTDVRSNTLWNPYWITSAEIDEADCEDKTAILFSFPATKYGNLLIVEKICIQITEAMATGTEAVDVGLFTLATDAVTTGGVCTVTDQDEYIKTADVTCDTLGTYWAATSDWLTVRASAIEDAVTLITPADATVQCIGAFMSSNTTLTAGKARVHALILEVPTV